MKKIITMLLIVMLILGTTAAAVSAKNSSKGFDETGMNLNAGIYKTYIMPEVFMIQKWSKDWTYPMNTEDAVGAYLHSSYTWYSDEFPSMENGFGMMALAPYTQGRYKMVESVKIMKVSDDPQAWMQYAQDGLIPWVLGVNPDNTPFYLQYESGAPIYVALQDELTVYDTQTGEVIFSADGVGAVKKGLGQPLY